MMTIFVPMFQALLVGTMALIGIVVTQSWTSRREWAKRRIELAEEVLSLFYEARDGIRAIRSPMSRGDEGSTRKRSDNETEAVTRFRDQAYVVVERFKKEEAVFNGLQTKRYRFMAMFRGNARQPFDEIDAAVREIFVSAEMLQSIYWPNQGYVAEERRAEHVREKHEHEAIIWQTKPQDSITESVEGAIRKVEAIADAAAKDYVGFRRWL